MITLRYPPHVGGTELAAATLSHALVQLGHQVTVITGIDGSEPSSGEDDGVLVERIPLTVRGLAGAPYVRRVVTAARRRGRHDVVNAHMASAPAMAAAALSTLWRVPAVVKPSSGAGPGGGNLLHVMTRPAGRLRVALLRNRIRAFVAVSAPIADDLTDVWRIPPDRVVRIPNGVDLARFPPVTAATTGAERSFLYVGRLDPSKGVDVLLEAWSLAGQPGRLLLVGDGPERTELENSAPPSVSFAGAVERPEEWYRRADVFVLPSRREGLSNALLEAVASGLPVIATAVGETPNVLRAAGRLVPPEDADSLAQALQAPLPKPVELSGFAERFGTDAVARRHLELYTRLLGGRPA